MRRYGAAGGADWRLGLRQRLGVLGLTLLIEMVVLLLVILFGGSRIREQVSGAASTAIVFIQNPTEKAATPQKQARAEKAATKLSPPVVSRPVPPRIMPVRQELPFIPMTKADLAASDIAKLGSAAKAGAGAGEASGATAASGPGDGPGGVQLYNAEWVVEPSDAQLRPYLPKSVAAGSWALIACQTIAHNHVENCAQMGEGPRGSGLSKAMRLAAWQFLIHPPRIDGKPQVGAWVRIRMDFRDEKTRE
jgi:protein TonB